MTRPFEEVIQGRKPVLKLLEDDEFLAFLNPAPSLKGHILVIPKKLTDDIFDICDEELMRFIVFAKRTALALRESVPCRKVGMTVIGLQTRHAHIHLLPINTQEDMDVSKTVPFETTEPGLVQKKIIEYLNTNG